MSTTGTGQNAYEHLATRAALMRAIEGFETLGCTDASLGAIISTVAGIRDDLTSMLGRDSIEAIKHHELWVFLVHRRSVLTDDINKAALHIEKLRAALNS